MREGEEESGEESFARGKRREHLSEAGREPLLWESTTRQKLWRV